MSHEYIEWFRNSARCRVVCLTSEFTEWFRNSTRCRIVFPAREFTFTEWSGIWCRVSHEFTEWWLVIWRSVVVSCCVPGVDSRRLRLWRTVVDVGVVYPTSLRSGWKFSDVLCVPRVVHGVIVNSANCHVVKVIEWLGICRPVVSCVTRDLRFTEWLGIWRHGCRVSHKFTKWLGIWRPVVSCVPRIYGVGGNLTTCRVVCPSSSTTIRMTGVIFKNIQMYNHMRASIWQSHAYIIYDNHIRVSYMIITCVHHISHVRVSYVCVKCVWRCVWGYHNTLARSVSEPTLG